MLDAIRSVFVPLLPEQTGADAPLRYAAGLARASSAHVTARALGLKIDQPYTPFGAIAGGFVSTANKAAQEKAEASAASARATVDESGRPVDAAAYVGSHAELCRFAANQARLHDLSVLGRASEVLGEGRAIIEELLFGSGRPLIIVPPNRPDFALSRVVLAWDGSSRAARAAHDALPFLRQAQHADIVCVTNEKDLANTIPGAEFAPFLARHGLKVTVSDLTAADRSAARAIREHATLTGADLIVMGGYAHARFRQLVMGGVTDSMLHNAELPVLMSY